MNIVILDGYTLNPGDLTWDSFKKLGNVKIYDRTSPNKLNERIKYADIILTNKTVLDKEAIDATNARYIGVLATGYNIVDIAYAKEKEIYVTNIPSYGTYSVAQFTFSHILNIFSNVSEHVASVKNGEWTSNLDWTYWKTDLQELYGKTIGIIGYGKIGRVVGEIARSFGMNVLALKSNRNTSNEEILVSMDELLKKSHIISLHCPLTAETENIISRKNIEKMMEGVVIINTSRGELVHEVDLAEALNTGKVRAAGLDVASIEPIRKDNPLLSSKNTYITPHIAWATKQARSKLMDIAVENLKAYLDNKPINIVN